MLKESSIAPDFSLPGNDGKIHHLSQQKGKCVVVYFYPRDNTPGCTTEACDFKDNMEIIADNNCIVYGISRDSMPSHQKFSDKYNLNFTLLSDEMLEAHKAFKVLNENKTIRATFLIDKEGKIAKVWPKVSVKGHVMEVIRELLKLGSS